jgi:hypothetical protein
MTAIKTVVSVVTTVALTALVAYGSGVSVPWHPHDDAALRVSWSVRPERFQHCRTLSPEELASRPEHMRQAMECDGAYATYDLAVTIGDSLYEASVVRGSGIRHDRPMFLLRNYRVSSGEHHVKISLVRREATDSLAGGNIAGADTTPVASDRRARELEQRREMALNAFPAHLVLDTVLHFPANGVALVTIENRTLTARTR